MCLLIENVQIQSFPTRKVSSVAPVLTAVQCVVRKHLSQHTSFNTFPFFVAFTVGTVKDFITDILAVTTSALCKQWY